MNPQLLLDIQSEINKKYNGDITLFIQEINQLLEQKSPTKQKTEQALPKESLGTPTNEPIVTITALSKIYKVGGDIVKALDNINLTIKKGEMVAIMGPSGSGKSTFLNMIAGLEKPTSGSVVVAGYNVPKLTDNQVSQFRNRTLGFIFQFFYLQPFLKIRENVEIPLFFADIPKHKRYVRSKKLLSEIGLESKEKHLPRHLSGGQMQRIAIIRAMVNEPKVILADEPTGNLDSKTGSDIMDLLAKVNRELSTTIIVVTHDEKIAKRTHRIVSFEDGKIIN